MQALNQRAQLLRASPALPSRVRVRTVTTCSLVHRPDAANSNPVSQRWSPLSVADLLIKKISRRDGVVPQATGGGPGGPGKGGSGGGGGGGGGDGSGNGESGAPGSLPSAIASLLAAAGRTVDSFPADFKAGLLAGKVTPEILKRYLELEANFFAKMVWGIQGFRERLLGDPSFPVKVAIEVCIGVVTKIMAEKAKRDKEFWNEIDFVAANVAMAIIADFMLTWIPAPTLSLVSRKATSSNALINFFASCPDNAFQRVPPGMEPFSLLQRVGAILRNGTKLLGVGFCASLLGVGMTNALSGLRQMLEPGWAPLNKPQNVLHTSAAYGVYMSVSSNLRYQIIAGIIEERGIETLFKGQHQLCHVLSFAVRTANTFVGSLLWVDFVRLMGMQSAKPKAVEALDAPAVSEAPVAAAAGHKGKGKKDK